MPLRRLGPLGLLGLWMTCGVMTLYVRMFMLVIALLLTWMAVVGFVGLTRLRMFTALPVYKFAGLPSSTTMCTLGPMLSRWGVGLRAWPYLLFVRVVKCTGGVGRWLSTVPPTVLVCWPVVYRMTSFLGA